MAEFCSGVGAHTDLGSRADCLVTRGAPAAHTCPTNSNLNLAFPAGANCTTSGMGLQVEFKVVVRRAAETGTPSRRKGIAEPERPGH